MRGPDLDAHADPTELEREYYRHVETGDRGYLVKRDGKDAIKWDRPNSRDYSTELIKWQKERTEAPRFSSHQITLIAFRADRELCRALGQLDQASREWLDLSEKQRRKWMEFGPQTSDPDRKALWRSIWHCLKDRHVIREDLKK